MFLDQYCKNKKYRKGTHSPIPMDSGGVDVDHDTDVRTAINSCYQLSTVANPYLRSCQLLPTNFQLLNC